MTRRIRTVAFNLITLSLLLQILTGCGLWDEKIPSASKVKPGTSTGRNTTAGLESPGKTTASNTGTYHPDTIHNSGNNDNKESPGSTPARTPDNGGNTEPVNPGPTPGIPGNDNPSAGTDIDLGGRDVRIAVLPGHYENSVQAWLRENRSEKYNFNVIYETGGQGDTLWMNFISNFLSGIWFADVIMIRGEQAFPYMVSGGMIHPLDDYIDFRNGLYANVFQNNTLWKGTHYGIQDGIILPFNLMTYNIDLIRAAGQPDPYTLQQQGLWNFEAFKNVAEACTDDKNGDGRNDVWGISIYNHETFARNMLHANGADYTEYIGGKYVFALDKPAALQTMNFISELLNYYNVAVVDNGSSFDNGRAAFTSEVRSRNSKIPQNCGVVYYPKGYNSYDYVNVSTKQPFYAFPTNSEIPIEKLAPALADMWAYWNPQNERYQSFEDYLKESLWLRTRAISERDIPTLIDAALNKLMIPAHSNFMDFSNFCVTQIFNKLSTSASVSIIVENAREQASAILEQYN